MTTRAKRLPYAERHAQLLDLAEELFIEHGYGNVSMEDICRAAGVSRPVVYEHLGSKDGAYIAIVDRARAEYQAQAQADRAQVSSPRDLFRAGGNAYFAMLERNPGRWKLIVGSGVAVGGAAADRLSQDRFESIAEIHGVLAAHAGKGVPADVVEAAAHAMSGVGERLGHWWLTRADLTREQIVDLFVDLLWDGLAGILELSGE